MATKKFIYGIAVVKFNSKEIGYIEKGSWDWGGTKAESTDIEAEQVPDAPVLTLANKNATIAPTFNLIQLDYENIAAVLGGIGIIPGAMLGGILIGLIEIFVKLFAPGWYEAVTYGTLIVILLVKPSGILGKNVGEKV